MRSSRLIEPREPAGERRLDLALVLAQLRLDVGQTEERVRLLLGPEGPELGVIVGHGLAVLADAQEALLGQAPTLVAGALAKADVVFLGSGEVDAVRARGARRHDHQVDLRTAEDLHRGLVAALVEHLVDQAERRESLDETGAIIGLGQEVEVADRVAAAAERPGRLDGCDAGCVREGLDDAEDRRLGPVQVHAARGALEAADALEDQLLGPLAQPTQAADGARLGSRAQVLDREDPELEPDLADRLRPEARDAEQLDEARWHLGDELVVVGHPTAGGDLLDLVADRRPDARDLGDLAVAVGGDQVDRAPADGIGGPVIGDRLEGQLALDLEHVADLVEDPSEIAIGQVALGAFLIVAEVGVGRREVGIARVGGRLLRVELDLRAGIGRRISAGDASRHGRDGTRVGGPSRYAATTRSRPRRFALYRARSAISISDPTSSCGSFATATPIETLTGGTP